MEGIHANRRKKGKIRHSLLTLFIPCYPPGAIIDSILSDSNPEKGVGG
jgi:hypothetical protein